LKDAPPWMKGAGMQWLHRLSQELSRLWKRYLINNSAFLVNILLQMSGVKRYQLTETNVGSPIVAAHDLSQI